MELYRFDNTNLFLPDVDPDEISFAYFFSKDNNDPVQASITLDESWNRFIGIYIFLGKKVQRDKFAEFSTVLDTFFSKQQSLVHTGLMWLHDYEKIDQGTIVPSDRYPSCTYTTCTCKQNQTAPCFEEEEDYSPTIIYTKNGNGVQIKDAVRISIGTYTIPINVDSEIALLIDEQSISITYPQIAGAQNPASGKGIWIPLSGDTIGTIKGEACINNFYPDIQTGWNIGLRYNMYSTSALASQFYPVFDVQTGEYFLFRMQWDPMRPLDDKRTYLLFTGISFKLVRDENNPTSFSIQPRENPELIASFWKTIYGEAVSLKALVGTDSAPKLVFQQYINEYSEDLNYYLAPSGDFEFKMPGESGAVHKLLCGLAGTECIDVSTGDILSFYPGKAAYTDSYPVATSGSGPLLSEKCTTSWLLIKPGGQIPPIYYSAPQSASLFSPTTNPEILGSYYAGAGKFTTEVTKDGEYCFPMVPYAGIVRGWPMVFNEQDIAPFEQQILNRVRSEIISSIPISAESDEQMAGNTIVSATPQGLLATIEGLNWTKVLLAQNLEGTKELSFEPDQGQTGIPFKLRNALQTDDLFLVISDNAHIGKFNSGINIENWNFNINVPKRDDPDKDAEFKNILLFKFRKGAIIDLVRDVNYWTAALEFNYDSKQITSTQTNLTQYCVDAIKLSEDDSSFEHFSAIIQDPNWFGIIAFNVDINLGEFPGNLKALIGAMDLKRFRAHHIGVDSSFIQSAAGSSITAEKTSLFGLISYTDKDYAKEENQPKGFNAVRGNKKRTVEEASVTDTTYAYKVLKLQVVFANSAVSNFESQLQLTARKWFDEGASLTKPSNEGEQKLAPNYSMLFKGHYENHDGHPTYTFLTEKGMEYLYYVNSKVINYVEFAKAQFSTTRSAVQAGHSGTEKVSGLFSFVGYLNFRKIEKFDFLSYGSEAEDEKRKGLYFSRMAVDVNFDLDTLTNEVKDLALSFNPLQIAFDPAHSTIRNNSLVSNLPLSPQSILSGDKQQMPSQLGFLHIKPPVDFKSSALGDKWYGLNTDFLWGGPGALADKTGFVPNILLAWSPGGSDLYTDILICLPGGGGGSTFSLQNVIKLKVGSLRFIKVEDPGNSKINYNLMLNNISLSLMGLGFPPAGSVKLALMGNPDDAGTLGWYGSYKK